MVSGVSAGYTESTASTTTATVEYMDYGNKTGCPANVEGRTSIVNYGCGGSTLDTNVITNVREHNTCEYTFTVVSSACCTTAPTRTPSGAPSKQPTLAPSRAPSKQPTPAPTRAPTRLPTPAPTFDATQESCARDPATFAGLQLISPVLDMTFTIGSKIVVQGGVNCGKDVSSEAISHVTTQMYTNGDVGLNCATVGIPYGQRETMVQYRCGLRREVVSFGESARCSYLMQVRMPDCCTDEEWNTLRLAATGAPTGAPSQHATDAEPRIQVIELKRDTDDKFLWGSLAALLGFVIITSFVSGYWYN